MYNNNNIVKGHEFKLVEYRNGYYQGDLINGKKDGKGIYYFDTGQVYLGNWKQDFMEGQGVFYFSDGGFYTGIFSKSKTHDTGVYQNHEGDILYVGNYKYGAISDKFYKYQLKDQILETFENNKKISSENMDMDIQTIPNLKVKFREIFETFQKSKNSNRDFAIVDFKDNSWYVGLISQHMKPEGIGILHDCNNKAISRGYFKGKQLQGFGRKLLDNKTIHDGIFVNDTISMGIKYDKLLNKYEYGSFNKVGIKIKQSGTGLPTELLRCFKHPNSLAQKRIDKATNSNVMDLKQFEIQSSNNAQNTKKRSQTLQNPQQNQENIQNKNLPMLVSFGPQFQNQNNNNQSEQQQQINSKNQSNIENQNNNDNNDINNINQNYSKYKLNTEQGDYNFNKNTQSFPLQQQFNFNNNFNHNNSTKESSVSYNLPKYNQIPNNYAQNFNYNNNQSNFESSNSSISQNLSNKQNNLDNQKLENNNQPNTPRFDHLQNSQKIPSFLENINLQEYPYQMDFPQTEEDQDEKDDEGLSNY